VVECNAKVGEVAQMFAMHAVDQRLGGDAFFFGAQHDGRAVGVIGADVVHRIAPHALVAHPDVTLDVSDKVAEMDVAVGVGQGVGDEDLARHDGFA